MTVYQLSLLTPLGALTVTQADEAIVSLDWGEGRDQTSTALLKEASDQLHAYFDGARKQFDLPLAPPVTPFTQRVLSLMQSIAFGETRTYGDIAKALNTAPRAVGGACGRNPIPIIIPCHRVLATGHKGGYSGQGGLETKDYLLRLEGALQSTD